MQEESEAAKEREGGRHPLSRYEEMLTRQEQPARLSISKPANTCMHTLYACVAASPPPLHRFGPALGCLVRRLFHKCIFHPRAARTSFSFVRNPEPAADESCRISLFVSPFARPFSSLPSIDLSHLQACPKPKRTAKKRTEDLSPPSLPCHGPAAELHGGPQPPDLRKQGYQSFAHPWWAAPPSIFSLLAGNPHVLSAFILSDLAPGLCRMEPRSVTGDRVSWDGGMAGTGICCYLLSI